MKKNREYVFNKQREIIQLYYTAMFHMFTAENGIDLFVCLMVFNTTFNNISAISWQSVLLVEETGGPGENHRPFASR